MKVFIVYWHPEPQSFNHAMLETAINAFIEKGDEVKISNLHEMNFDPVSSRKNFKTIKHPDYFKQQIEELHATEHNSFSDEIENEIAKMEWCDLMIWQFPLWGVFKNKKAMLSLTTGGSADAYKPGAMMGDVMSLLKPIHYGMLRFVGYDVLSPHIVYAPVRLTVEERRAEFVKYSNRLNNIMNEDSLEIVGF